MDLEDIEITGNIIKDFTKIASAYLDSPIIFIKLAAYWLASSTIGRFIQDPMTANRMRPNLFVVLSSIPGRTRRSAIVGLARRVYRKALFEFFKSRGFPSPAANDLEYNKSVSETILEEGTAEGITDHLQRVETYHLGGCQGESRLYSSFPEPIVPETFVLIHPEIGTFFSRMNTLSYLSTVMTVFSKLYDGEGGRVYLSHRGKGQPKRYLPWNIYFTSLGTMQEPQLYLDEKMFRQGLMRRIMLSYYDVSKEEKAKELEERWKPMRNVDRELLNKKLDELGEAIARQMKMYDEICRALKRPINPVYEPEALDFIEKMEKRFDSLVLERVNDATIYQQSYPEKIEKMTLLYSICKRGVDKTDGTFMVLKSSGEGKYGDFTDPVEIVTQTMGDVEEIIMKLRVRPRVVETEEDLHTLVRYYIEASGRDGVSMTDLIKRLRVDVDRLWNTLRAMMTPIEKPEVVALKVRTGRRGRPTMLFVSTKFLTDEEVKNIVRGYEKELKERLAADQP